MYEQIASNINKTRLLMGLFVALVAVLGYAFGEASGAGWSGLVFALIVSTVMSFTSYYYSDRIVLAMSGARPVTKEEYPYLWNTVEGLAIAAGIPAPKTYVIDDTAMNAFATGRDPEHAAIAVTTGLLSKLNRQELEGVVAHEMSHIRNRDILLASVTVVLVGVAALLSDWMMRSFLWGGSRRRRERSGRGQAGAVIVVIALVLAILAPLAAQLIRFAISRKREFLADADGALLTRYPPGLADALEKIAADTEPLEAANRATAHLYIVNPLKDSRGRASYLYSTHPPIQERIARLRSM
ncbi:MAG: zinc metalloprotease HtpX [Firmicutes bacterium]|jgi:heat shock protein HtpX|nr:zinc metalloprotease HtpX [Bacillota bacterium]MDH7494605.1 zinc metalloprotease HtpX [Bacillota bacterium]